MADVAVFILRVVSEIRDLAEGIKENDRQASRLIKRVTAVEAPVLAVKQGTRLSSSESLRQLLATVKKIRDFLDKYARTRKIDRALRRKPNAEKFTRLGAILTEGMQALQLDVAVDMWAKEDASDRMDDLENMLDAVEIMQRNQTGNHAEIMGALKVLRIDERSELAGWVEIDYGKDLDFEGSTMLGSGGFGEVRTAKWNGSDVAVKHLLASGLQRDAVRALRKEIRVHSSLHFDFVVPLYAASTIRPHLCLVVELARGGSLQHFLHSTSEPLAHALQAAFLHDIARGMSFLHMKGILHRDLKSANVLMFANSRLKLCDFGLSKIKTDLSSRSAHGAVGTTQWMSPEEMDASPTNELTDVYSFGVLCFEVSTRTEPFKGKRPAQVIGAVLYRDERPQIPEWASASPDVVPLMEQCWKQDPAERPEGFGPVVRALATVVSRVGDPRSHSAVAVDVTSSSGAKRSGGAPSVGMSAVPPTVSDGVDVSLSWPDSASQSAGADLGATADKSNVLPPAVSGSGRDVPALEEDVLWGAANETGTNALPPDTGNVYAPSADLPTASKGPPPSRGTSGRFKKLTKMVGPKLSTRGKYEQDFERDLHKRAKQLREQGKYDEAAPLYLRAIEIQERTLGPDHPDLATTLNNLAELLTAQGKFAEADPLYIRAIEILQGVLGPEHPDVASALNNRAVLLENQGGGVVASTGIVAVAKYDYIAQGEEQLSFRVGDVVQLHTKMVNAKGWGLGGVNGKVGWFPGDFVEMRPSAAERKPRTSNAATSSASRNRRPNPSTGVAGGRGGGGGGGEGGTSSAAQGQGGQDRAPPPPYPGRHQRTTRASSGQTGAGGDGGGGGGTGDGSRTGTGALGEHQSNTELYRTPNTWGTAREKARVEGHGGREPEQLPEHLFAIQMAKNQPWRDRLTPGGKIAYNDLLVFFKASRMVLDFDEIELKSVIESGAFATVFRGIYRHKIGRPGEGGDKKMEVAVKKLVGGGGGPMEKTLKDFKTECMLLSRLKHRNIIALAGVTTHPVTCVMQYCSRGNLMVLLDDGSVELSWKMKKQMMLDIAAGMQYLHGQNPVIIHRDLKSVNVLIDENWVTKLTDCGLSRFKATSVSEKITGQAGTFYWMAPEVINSQHYTEKADVFSYGIILWEIFTRAIPYGGMQPVQVVAAVLGRRERPRIPSLCPRGLAQLMQACWSHIPDQRPCFDDVVPWLESL